MAGLLGGMNLRKPNIPANTGGAMAQGLTTGMQMGQNIWENVQRNAQWNMTKDIGLYEYNLGKAYDANLPTEMRNNHGKTAMKLGEKILGENNPNLFDNENNLIVAKPITEFNKRLTGLHKDLQNKKINFQDFVTAIQGNASELGINMESNPTFTAMKELERENRKKGEDIAAKQGLLGLNPDKFGIPSRKTSPTIEDSLANTQRDERIGLLTSQPYDYLKGIATEKEYAPSTPDWKVAMDDKGIRRWQEQNTGKWGGVSPPEKQNMDEDAPIDAETVKKLQADGYNIKYGISYRAFNLLYPITETTTGVNQFGEKYESTKKRERGEKTNLKPQGKGIPVFK